MSIVPPIALPDRPVIAIVGTGALGGYYGARLAQHGHDVHFLLRSDYDAVKANGWTVRSCDGDFVIRAENARTYRSPADMPKADLVIVALKTTSNDQLEGLVRPLTKKSTVALTLQNGLGNEERLAALVGPDNVLGGIAFVCINRGQPGEILHLSHGLIRVGALERRDADPRPAQVAQWFASSKVKCEAVPDLMAIRWQKLVWNIPFNGLGAVMDLTTDRLIATPPGEQLVRAIMAEVIAAATAQGVKMRPDMIDFQIANTREMGNYKTSMQIDRHEGRPLEVEAILREPLRRAKAQGVAMPLLESLCAMARAI